MFESNMFSYSSRLLRFAIVLACSCPVLASNPAYHNPSDYYGAESNTTGDPIGGGAGYSQIITTGDYTVTDKTELLSALAVAESPEVIYVANDIDVTGESFLSIPAGVTLAGNRGSSGSLGPRIYSTDLGSTGTTKTALPLFYITQDDVRVTGLRIEGSDSEIRLGNENNYELWTALYCAADNIEIDNCEIYGWGNNGVYGYTSLNLYVHHSYIHHCRRDGGGYGVLLREADALIEGVRFDNCRRGVGSEGYPDTSYEVSHCIFHENIVDYPICSNNYNGVTTSTSLKIHHNTIYAASNGQGIIRIEGKPENGCWVYHNWFLSDSQSDKVYQTNTTPSGSVDQYTKSEHDTNRFWAFQNKVGPDQWGSQSVSSTDRYLVGDFSGDQIDDILYFESNGKFMVQVGTTIGFNTSWDQWKAGNSDISKDRYRLGYFDADSKMDILAIKSDAKFYVWTSTGTQFNNPVQWSDNPRGDIAPARYKIADFDNDDQSDIISFESNGSFNVWIAGSGAFANSAIWGSNGGDYGLTERYKIADMGNDGYPDVLSFEPYVPVAVERARFYRWNNSSGVGFSTAGQFGDNDENWPGGRYQISDINNDGKDDVLVYESSDPFYTRPIVTSYISTGTTDSVELYHVLFETDVE